MKRFEKIRDALAEIKIRMDRGNLLVYWARNVILIVAGLKFILTLNLLWSVILGLGVVFLFYLLGALDLDVFHFQQREHEILTQKYNYYFSKLMKKFK